MQTLWLLGGLGLGAGLMYLLDPQQGEERRDRVREYAVDYGRQTGDYCGRHRAEPGSAGAGGPCHDPPAIPAPARALGNGCSHKPSSWGTTTGMVLVGCVGLGVGLGYLWARQGSPQQRARLREKARTYWRPTETRSCPPAGALPALALLPRP